MGCAICGANFELVNTGYKYLKMPVGLTIISKVFLCNGNIRHFYTAVETETLAETKKKQKEKRAERKAQGKELPYNPEVTKPYSKRTDLGEPTEDEKRIADKTKDMSLEELKALCK